MAAPVVKCPNCGTKNRLAAREEGVPRCASCHRHLPWLVPADSAGFDAEIKASVPVLVDFWAPWCGPCKWVEPAVEEAARENAGRLKVVKVNVDEAPAVSARYDVQGIPALVVIRDGQEVDRLVGAVSKQHLEERLSRHVAEPAAAQS
jgi:thioredoxin 2